MRNICSRLVWAASAACVALFGLANFGHALQVEKGQAEKFLPENLDQNQRFFVVINNDEDEPEKREQEAPRYWLGISLKPIDGDLATYLGTNDGVLVDSLYPDSPAVKAGLQKGDILIEVNGQKLTEPQTLLAQMLAMKPTDEGQVPVLKLKLLRKGETVSIELTPTERPAELAPQQQESQTTEDNAGERKVLTLDLRGKSPEDIEKMVEGGLRVFRLGQPTGWNGRQAQREMDVKIQRDHNGKKLEISITRNGDGPAKIMVTQDGETNVYTSEKMEEMPEDIRTLVQDMLDKKGQIVVEAGVGEADDQGAGSKASDSKQSNNSSQSQSRIAIVGPEGLYLNIGEFIKGEAMHKELADKYRAMAEEIANRAEKSALWAKNAAAMPQDMKSLQSQVEALRSEVQELRQQLKQKEKESADK